MIKYQNKRFDKAFTEIFQFCMALLERIYREKQGIPGLNFINIKRANFTYENLFWQLFLVTFWLWQKICIKNARV